MSPVQSPGPGTDPLLRADHAPAPRTLVDVLRATVDDHPDDPAIDNGREVLTYDELLEAARTSPPPCATRAWAEGTGWGCGSPAAPPTSTSPSSASCSPVRPTCRSTPTTPTSGRAWSSTRPTWPRWSPPTWSSCRPGCRRDRAEEDPDLTDDAWIIFTSGSTGTPKGVAVTHRSAAAFVDAEARLFLQDRPIGPGDRVMAGLSVAFDASCEEMWLAWRYGACLVPAPRSLVAAGMDLGPWLRANDITVVSTVPTLVALWPAAALADVRLLILGGEACPPEIGARLATPRREVWNTYGPTEATVVACGARLTGEPPVRIGLPLDGWDLAVVDAAGRPRARRRAGRADHRRRRAGPLPRPGQGRREVRRDAHPGLGPRLPQRRPRPVRRRRAGVRRPGRRPGQGRRPAHRAGRGRQRPARAPGGERRRGGGAPHEAGNSLLVGYVTTEPGFDAKAAIERLRRAMPAALVPRLAVVDTLPTRTSGKIDRDALPWPPPARPGTTASEQAPGIEGTAAWVAGHWTDILGGAPSGPDDDFFDLGGGSLTAAQLVSRLRERFPEVTVADVYEHPGLAELAAALDDMATPTGRQNSAVLPVPLKTQAAQVVASVGLRSIGALRWLTWVGLGALVGRGVLGIDWLPDVALGLGAARVAAARHPARPDAARRRGRPGRAPRGRPRALPRAAVPCTCGCGSPSASSTSSAPPASRRRPWSRSTHACSAAGSTRTSTCTASPRSPACSPSAGAARSSPRSTSPATGSTAATCTSAG